MERDDAAHLLHQCFDAQVTRTPDAVALRWQDESITYAALQERADRFAAGLRARGIGDGASVGLNLERSIAFVVSVLGILKANSAVVPLPPSYPEGRLRDILAFAALDAVISGDARLPPEFAHNVLPFDDVMAGGGATTQDPSHSGQSQQPAFVLCSSGSTGTPKMIVRSHRSFFHRLNWTWEQYPYRDGEVCCQKSHMTTTHAIYELFEPLLRGVPVHIIPDEETRNVEQFWEIIRRHGISRLLIVPSMLRVSLDMPGFVAPPLNVLVLMGEYVHHTLAGRALEVFPRSTQIFSIYGSTEASSTLVCDLRESYRPGEELPLGKPISPDVLVSVLGPTLEPVAPGEIGLLHMSGPALFSGYFRNPELTTSAFVTTTPGDAARFNTQDEVRVLPNGALQYVGRVDQTIKVRGYRVDLQEVERALLQHPDVTQAVVLPWQRDAGSASLLAFYTPGHIEHAPLFEMLHDRLPAYMIPSALVGVGAFPLTASGKVDRRQLLETYASRMSEAGPFAAGSDTEQVIADVWQRVLQHGDFDRDSRFFEVGGTSLTVFAAVQQLREVFALDRSRLSAESIYQFPSVAQLASHIDRLRSGIATDTPAATPILVTMKQGSDPTRPPFFVVASAGGTLGAYAELARTLTLKCDIIGVRDPFNWGERDPTMGFQEWTSVYVTAMRSRQPTGPYYVCAYSSAAQFGIEIAQHLRKAGEQVALLTLIDPLFIGGWVKGDLGSITGKAIYGSQKYRLAMHALGWVQLLAHRLRRRGATPGENNTSVTQEQYAERVAASRKNMGAIIGFSALLELNSGLRYTLAASDFSGTEPEQYLDVLLGRVKQLSPEVDGETIERVYLQYHCLQTPAQQMYQLQDYDGPVALFPADRALAGILSVQFRAHMKHLHLRQPEMGALSERTRVVSQSLTTYLRPHYLCMRNREFVASLARELEALLDEGARHR